jgi:hypothetical protein
MRKAPPPLPPTQATTLLWLARNGMGSEREIREGVGERIALTGLLRRSLVGVVVRRRRGVRPTAYYFATERGRLVASRLRSTVASTARADG